MNKSPAVLRMMTGQRGPTSALSSILIKQRIRNAKYFSSPPTTSQAVGAGGSTNPPVVSSTIIEATPPTEGGEADGQRATISKAMNAYLKRAKDHQEFMDTQEKEFVFGRRHLANMMGKDPENFTQRDIDEAIRYLFPSGLFEPRARPVMKPPQEIYPKQKAAQFDPSGRPHHPFFFTATPNFYYLMHEMVAKLNSLNKMTSYVSTREPELTDDNALAGSVWFSKAELEGKLLEKMNDRMYAEWVACFDRLALHPKRNRELEFIKTWRKPLMQQTHVDELPPITLEPDGRKSAHVTSCGKKTARGDVLVTVPGNGDIKINGKGLDFFLTVQAREMVISPLQLVGWLGKCDVEANVQSGTRHTPKVTKPQGKAIAFFVPDGGNEGIEAGAIRWGIATALAALGADMERLRLAGYLKRDGRNKERTKVGYVGARAKWTWKKR